MDRILLTGIEVFAHHGVLPHEQQIGQRFVIDLELELDLTRACDSDDLSDTLDYGAVIEKVAGVAAGERWNLIERVAQRVAETALAFEPVGAVSVTVHKPEAPLETEFADIAVTIRRERRA